MLVLTKCHFSYSDATRHGISRRTVSEWCGVVPTASVWPRGRDLRVRPSPDRRRCRRRELSIAIIVSRDDRTPFAVSDRLRWFITSSPNLTFETIRRRSDVLSWCSPTDRTLLHGKGGCLFAQFSMKKPLDLNIFTIDCKFDKSPNVAAIVKSKSPFFDPPVTCAWPRPRPCV